MQYIILKLGQNQCRMTDEASKCETMCRRANIPYRRGSRYQLVARNIEQFLQ